MKRFNKMTERQMTKANGGVAWSTIGIGACITGLGMTFGVTTSYLSGKKKH